jgi:hypothetical protein
MGDYLMMIFLKDGPEKIKKCVCNHEMKQKDILEKVDYTLFRKKKSTGIFKCDSCDIVLNYSIL